MMILKANAPSYVGHLNDVYEIMMFVLGGWLPEHAAQVQRHALLQVPQEPGPLRVMGHKLIQLLLLFLFVILNLTIN